MINTEIKRRVNNRALKNCVKPCVPREPRRDSVIVCSMNMGYDDPKLSGLELATWNLLPKHLPHLRAHPSMSPTQTGYSLLSLYSSQFLEYWKLTSSLNLSLPKLSLSRSDTLKLDSAWYYTIVIQTPSNLLFIGYLLLYKQYRLSQNKLTER